MHTILVEIMHIHILDEIHTHSHTHSLRKLSMVLGKWIHKNGKSRPDKRFKNILTPKKGAAKNKRRKK